MFTYIQNLELSSESLPGKMRDKEGEQRLKGGIGVLKRREIKGERKKKDGRIFFVLNQLFKYLLSHYSVTDTARGVRGKVVKKTAQFPASWSL